MFPNAFWDVQWATGGGLTHSYTYQETKLEQRKRWEPGQSLSITRIADLWEQLHTWGKSRSSNPRHWTPPHPAASMHADIFSGMLRRGPACSSAFLPALAAIFEGQPYGAVSTAAALRWRSDEPGRCFAGEGSVLQQLVRKHLRRHDSILKVYILVFASFWYFFGPFLEGPLRFLFVFSRVWKQLEILYCPHHVRCFAKENVEYVCKYTLSSGFYYCYSIPCFEQILTVKKWWFCI